MDSSILAAKQSSYFFQCYQHQLLCLWKPGRFSKLKNQIGGIIDRGNVPISDALRYRFLELKEKLGVCILTATHTSAVQSWRFISIGNCMDVSKIKN